MHLSVCPCHVTYVFQEESTLYICLNVKELLAQKERDIGSLSGSNDTRNHNHLVPKRTLNHLVKLTKGLSWVVRIYLYSAFDCICSSYHVPLSEWIHTLYLPECQESRSSKKARYVKFKWLRRDSNPQPLSSEMKTQIFGQTYQVIELSCEHLHLRWIWICVLLMSRAHFRVNPQSIFAWFSTNSFLETGEISEVQVTATWLEPTTT